MPKDNIDRAIKKIKCGNNRKLYHLRYEGFGPHNVAFIIETLTDNKKIDQPQIFAKYYKKMEAD